MLYAKRSIRGGVVVNVSAAFSVSVRSCDSLIMPVLGLKSNIEVPKDVDRFWMWNTT